MSQMTTDMFPLS